MFDPKLADDLLDAMLNIPLITWRKRLRVPSLVLSNRGPQSPGKEMNIVVTDRNEIVDEPRPWPGKNRYFDIQFTIGANNVSQTCRLFCGNIDDRATDQYPDGKSRYVSCLVEPGTGVQMGLHDGVQEDGKLTYWVPIYFNTQNQDNEKLKELALSVLDKWGFEIKEGSAYVGRVDQGNLAGNVRGMFKNLLLIGVLKDLLRQRFELPGLEIEHTPKEVG